MFSGRYRHVKATQIARAAAAVTADCFFIGVIFIDKKMKKKDLQKASGISSSSVAKLGRNENVNTEILQKICIALHCDISEIMEMEDETNT